MVVAVEGDVLLVLVVARWFVVRCEEGTLQHTLGLQRILGLAAFLTHEHAQIDAVALFHDRVFGLNADASACEATDTALTPACG